METSLCRKQKVLSRDPVPRCLLKVTSEFLAGKFHIDDVAVTELICVIPVLGIFGIVLTRDHRAFFTLKLNICLNE